MIVLREKIESLINNEARMLSFRHNVFEISYLPKGRQPIYISRTTWGRENRQTAKPARIIQKLLLREFKCKEFEDFSNWLKNEIIIAGEFVLVEGSDITKYYNEENYVECKGTLGNSCMRYSKCKNYFGIYEDHAKMLICRKDDKILGRAIVWELPQGTFMDRVYTCYDFLENQFIDYAEKYGWYHRASNELLSDGDCQKWLGPKSEYKVREALSLTIPLSKNYERVPYVDSFRYYNESDNSINTNPDCGDCCLSCTDGYYGDDVDLTYYTCDCCGHEERCNEGDVPDDFYYSNYNECWYCSDCAYYCDGIDDYISINDDRICAYNEDSRYSCYPENYIIGNNDFVLIGDNYYHTECDLVTFNEETSSYILK